MCFDRKILERGHNIIYERKGIKRGHKCIQFLNKPVKDFLFFYLTTCVLFTWCAMFLSAVIASVYRQHLLLIFYIHNDTC
jgi:hypothetical protein